MYDITIINLFIIIIIIIIITITFQCVFDALQEGVLRFVGGDIQTFRSPLNVWAPLPVSMSNNK